jgi:hypothetical protein
MIRPRLRHPLSLPPHNARLIVDFERSGQYVKGTEVPEKIFKGRGLFKRVLFLLHRDLSRSRAKAHANFASDFFFLGMGGGHEEKVLNFLLHVCSIVIGRSDAESISIEEE